MAIGSFIMLTRCCLLLLCLTCVQPTEDVRDNVSKDVIEYHKRFALWPSMHNAASARFSRNRRNVAEQKVSVKPGTDIGPSEGGDEVQNQKLPAPVPTVVTSGAVNKPNTTEKVITEVKPDKLNNETVSGNSSDSSSVLPATSQSATNGTAASKVGGDTEKPPPKEIDLNNPGVLKRAFIVFGGFALLAVAYFIFYKRKGKNNNSSNNHSGTNDTNQFRYGVLQSEDRRDNMELSRVPLTMESDEDEEDDLEIFDLEQKKKSLSYVNLPLNDEDIVLSPSNERDDRENLLLDIESANSDTLINWSSNTNNKSIL